MDCSPSFEGFHTQLDCKLTNDNKNQTQLTLVWFIWFRVKKKKKNKTGMMEKYTQSGITVKFILIMTESERSC